MLADAKQTVPPGCSDLVEALDRAASEADVGRITLAVQEVLSAYARAGRVELPEELRRPCESSYARRLVHRSEALDYTILAMVWGPEQGTPVHDHSGMWCVEGVDRGPHRGHSVRSGGATG